MAKIAHRLAFVAGLYGACGAGPAAAEQLVSEDWQFQLTPYLWALARTTG
jgi:hypothetical protein